MRTGKELIVASKVFTKENRLRSWYETLLTVFLMIVALSAAFIPMHVAARVGLSVFTALLYVRMFTIYHDYQHHAILQHSVLASWLMKAFGIFILAPQTIWKRTHDHHHHHNSKLTTAAIGSYPTLSVTQYLKLTKEQQRLYLINRHPLTVLMGHLTLFIYWLNLKSFIQSPAKHLDSLASLLFHVFFGAAVWFAFGFDMFVFVWWIPYTLAFAMGSYLFYCQHNFPGARFKSQQDWKYEVAAMESTSCMVMSPLMHWFTGNIGLHHVHHLNSRIPFYRLHEAMSQMPELQHPPTTSWNPLEMLRCFRLKLWDDESGKMISLEEAKLRYGI